MEFSKVIVIAVREQLGPSGWPQGHEERSDERILSVSEVRKVRVGLQLRGRVAKDIE